MWCWLYLLPCSNNCRPPFVLLSVVDTFLVEVGINLGRFLMISCVLPVKDEMRETLRQLTGVQVWNFSWYQLTTVKLSLPTNFSWNKERISPLINELILINECIQCFPGVSEFTHSKIQSTFFSTGWVDGDWKPGSGWAASSNWTFLSPPSTPLKLCSLLEMCPVCITSELHRWGQEEKAERKRYSGGKHCSAY